MAALKISMSGVTVIGFSVMISFASMAIPPVNGWLSIKAMLVVEKIAATQAGLTPGALFQSK
ncbi:hypothetical protein DSCA_55680 [Desulfosarcina alkanivorans]|uniref:Uncharacterized protein n=1 Tax=Desulfosarcina alkanivorans TaxID=571177 RepID=A0A5K7YSM1_9BACT|nr:hypothetical protein DSCA_55680 [Desulfosarcina alkanivorans]